MSILLNYTEFPLTEKQVLALWAQTREARSFPEQSISLRCVSEDEIKRLNTQYRQVAAPTNVLTFSYPTDPTWPSHPESSAGEIVDHEIYLCLSIAKAEATARQLALSDYTALLLVHGYLHITGLDHEANKEAELLTQTTEKEILVACGFAPLAL